MDRRRLDTTGGRKTLAVEPAAGNRGDAGPGRAASSPGAAHRLAGDPGWSDRATQELITLLRDDYATLMAVLGAISDIYDL